MSTKKDFLWQAYLDGELSVGEMSEFEASLTSEERERLAAEMQFEGGLAERLSEDAACPADVWKKTKALLAGQQTKASRTIRPWYWGAATLAAAAMVAFTISVFAPVQTSPSPALVLAAETVEDLAALTETEAGRAAAQAYLKSHEIPLEIRDAQSLAMTSKHKHLEILGARIEYAAGEPVVAMLIGCCKRPVKVIVALQGSAAAQEIGTASCGKSQVRATRAVDGYLVAVVGEHTPYGLLEFFGD